VVNIAGLASGTYEADITVTAEGALESPQFVHVTLEISTTGLRRIDAIEIPQEFALYPPFPNPFNPATSFTFAVPTPGNVVLMIYDIQGRKVTKLMEGWCPAGVYQAMFDGSQLSSGVYFCRMIAPDFTTVKRMTLIK